MCPDIPFICHSFRDFMQNIGSSFLQGSKEVHGFCMWHPLMVLRYGL
jgi:hypothetical protein